METKTAKYDYKTETEVHSDGQIRINLLYGIKC